MDGVLTLVGMFARTPSGRDRIAGESRFLSMEEISLRHRKIEALQRLDLPSIGELDEKLRDVPLLGEEDPLEEKKAGAIVLALEQADRLRLTFSESREESLRAWVDELPRFQALLDRWAPRFTRDGRLKKDKFPELKRLTRRVESAFEDLQATLRGAQREFEAFLMEDLFSFRDERYCLQVKAAHQARVPGLYLGTSSSGQTVFIEPMDVIASNNAHRHARALLENEIRKILFDFRKELMGFVPGIQRLLDFISDLDMHLAFLRFMERSEGSLPEMVSLDEEYEIREGRHPLLDERFNALRQSAFGEKERDTHVIPLHLRWSPNHPILILSGPNGGGKTVALKTAALLVLMGRMGWPVPAEKGTKIPEFSSVMLYVGDEQDVLQDLSTFTGAMRRMKMMLEHVRHGTLLFIDEAGFGTDPEEGSALAAAILEHVNKSGGRAFITTHLTPLKMLPLSDSAFVNVSMTYDAESLTPTFKLHFGLPGSSHAIDVAAAVGLSSAILDRARELLGDQSRQRDQQLTHLQELITENREVSHHLQEQKWQLQKERENAARELALEKESLGNDLKTWKEKVLHHLQKELDHLRREKRPPGKKKEQALRDAVRKSPEFLASEKSVSESFLPGDRVIVKAGNVRGEVLDVSSSGQLCVSAGGKQVWLDPAQVERRSSEQRLPEIRSSVSRPEADHSVNLIGMRVDDALEKLDSSIDKAVLSGLNTIMIIHGHGTGKLRAAVRSHLEKHRLVTEIRPTSDNGATEVVV